jgi:hypothetical protein
MEPSQAHAAAIGPSGFEARASRLSNCFWCTGPHPAPHPLSVCPACVVALREPRFPMETLEMSGSFPLNDETIDQVVCRTSPGNYALGYMDGPTFMVHYVARSDSDVRDRLHAWVGRPSRFERYAPPTRAAWGSRPRAQPPYATPMLHLVGNAAESSYTRFAYSYAGSAEAAFEKECRNYRDFGGSAGLDNASCPVESVGSAGEC